MVLAEIIKTTAEEHPDLENLRQALVAVKRYAEDMNKAVKVSCAPRRRATDCSRLLQMSENKKEFARLSQIVEGLSAIRTPLLWSDEKVRVNVDGDEPATNLILFSDRLVFVRNNAVVLETPLHCAWVKPVGKAAESVFQVITPERKVRGCGGACAWSHSHATHRFWSRRTSPKSWSNGQSASLKVSAFFVCLFSWP